jgi:hypothetical protein
MAEPGRCAGKRARPHEWCTDHFTIAAEDRVFHPETAVIKAGAIVVQGD